jgi:hypothetical protein
MKRCMGTVDGGYGTLASFVESPAWVEAFIADLRAVCMSHGIDIELGIYEIGETMIKPLASGIEPLEFLNDAHFQPKEEDL